MKTIYIILFSLLLFSSCIQDEPKNAEADILSIHITPTNALKDEPKITNDEVVVFIKSSKIDVSQAAPIFDLTFGATINPPSRTLRDFTTPQTYVVTSENGQWSKEYTVSLVRGDIPLFFEFEHWREDSKSHYEMPYEIVNQEEQAIWASGSPGYALVAGKDPNPDSYPTHSTTDSRNGLAGHMETKLTNSMGMSVGKPIAAGNLFLGNFDASKAMMQPLKATKFGVPFDKEPLKLTGYYKYKAGSKVIAPSEDKKDTTWMSTMKDSCHFYAVLYLPADTEDGWLYGDNVLTSPAVVAKAVWPNGSETSGTDFHFFEMDFEYLPGKTINPDKLENFEYKIAIVFSASKHASKFIGAEGSVLIVDDVTIVVAP